MSDEREPEAWLGELLDAAAAEYEPDTERLRALVAERIAAVPDRGSVSAAPRPGRTGPGGRPRRPRRLGPLGRLGLAGIPTGLALAAIGAAAALAIGATATLAVTSNHDEHTTVAVLTPSGGRSTGAAPSQGSSTQRGSRPADTGGATYPASPSSHASSGDTGPPTGSASATVGGGANALYSATATVDPVGNANWSQLNVWVTARQRLTALEVTVRVSGCPGLASTGAWDTGASGQFTETTTQNPDGSISYAFVLDPGQTFSAGDLQFAAQFNHAATGWSPAGDTYLASAHTAASSTAAMVQGAY